MPRTKPAEGKYTEAVKVLIIHAICGRKEGLSNRQGLQ